MEKNVNNAQMILESLGRAIESGELTVKEVEKFLKQKSPGYRKKAYSEENIRGIAKMIRAGATSVEIRNVYNICKNTIRNYLFDFYSENYAKQLMKQLNENDNPAKSTGSSENEIKSESSDDTILENVQVIEPTDSAILENIQAEEPTDIDSKSTFAQEPESNSATQTNTEEIKYLIDFQMIQKFEGRIKMREMIAILEEKKAYFTFFSLNRILHLANDTDHKGPSFKAKAVLENYSVTDTETVFIQDYARDNNFTVITPSTLTKKFCDRNNVPVIMIEDFIRENMNETIAVNVKNESSTTQNTNSIDSTEDVSSKGTESLFEDFTLEKKTYSLPVKFNNVKRIITEIDALSSFIENTYSLTKVKVNIYTLTGKEKKTPTGVLRLCKEDLIKFVGKSHNNSTVTVYLRVIAETLQNNCYECRYVASTAEDVIEISKLG